MLLGDDPAAASPQRGEEKSATGLELESKEKYVTGSDNDIASSYADCSLIAPSKKTPNGKKKLSSFSKKKRKELRTLQTFLASGNADSPDFCDQEDASLSSAQTQDSIAIANLRRNAIKGGENKRR
jgi:hypothetical protein